MGRTVCAIGLAGFAVACARRRPAETMDHINMHTTRCEHQPRSPRRPLSDEQFAQSSLALVARWRAVLREPVPATDSDRQHQPQPSLALYTLERLLSASSEQQMAMPTTASAVGPSVS